MIQFKLSAFSDELSPEIDRQIEWLSANGLDYMEIRGVDGTPVAEITLDKAREVKAKLDAAGIRISALGSPAGKININDDFEPHVEQFRHLLEIAKILDAKRMRMFSFFMPEGCDPADHRDEVMRRLAVFAELARPYGVTLCHENEKNIYGDTPERCLDIYNHFGGEIKCVFDHANFISCDIEPFPHAYGMLSHTFSHMHIKDADENAEMVPAGEGIGRIPETLAALKEAYDGEFILTLEPHLMEFGGLAGLESEGHTSNLGNRYKNSDEAFEVALSSLRKYI